VSGIVAILATGGRILDPRELAHLQASLRADSETPAKQWNDDLVALASSPRTIDKFSRPNPSLSADASRDLTCLLEGQLHNASELVASLGGECFALTDSDLALQAYARWGETFVSRLRGEFALIVWDSRAKCLLCARDPIGIKALYLHKTDNSIVVTSNLAIILNLNGRAMPVNAKAIAAYLSGDPLITTTFYEGVIKLPASTTVAVSAKDGTRRTLRHWSPSDIKHVRYTRSEDYAEHFLSIFSEAIRCRLVGTRRTGLLLSGGLDSSSIACVASRIVSFEFPAADMLTFSVTSDHRMPDADGDIYDETSYINQVVGMYGIDARYFRYEDFLDEVEFTTMTQRTLPIPPGMGVFNKILRTASDAGVTVMLSGIGGDDMLGSNSDIYLLRYADLLSSGNIREVLEDLRHAHKYYSWDKVLNLLWTYGCWPLINSFFWRWSGDTRRQSRALSISQAQTYVMLLSGELAGYGLEAFDQMGQEAGIEFRYPYLDIRLVEFCLAVPSAELSRHYQSKLLLRRSMAGILPENLRLRIGKASSTSLLHTWLSEAIRPTVEALFAKPTLSQGVDWDLIRKSFGEYCRGNMEHSRQITKAIGLELWYRANNQGGTSYGLG
jgi:asparagine synthase (glutamine-hydrolysing)